MFENRSGHNYVKPIVLVWERFIVTDYLCVINERILEDHGIDIAAIDMAASTSKSAEAASVLVTVV